MAAEGTNTRSAVAVLACLLLPGVLAIDDELLDGIAENLNDILPQNEKTPVMIKVSLEHKPGHKDAKGWTTESVRRLLKVLQERTIVAPMYPNLKLYKDIARRLHIDGKIEYLREGKERAVSPQTEETPLPFRSLENTVLHIDNHFKAQLPSSEISLKTLVDLMPKEDPQSKSLNKLFLRLKKDLRDYIENKENDLNDDQEHSRNEREEQVQEEDSHTEDTDSESDDESSNSGFLELIFRNFAKIFRQIIKEMKPKSTRPTTKIG